MKWIVKKFLLIAFIGILALNVALTVKAYTNKPVQIIKQGQISANHEYIISEEMIMSKLKSKSQIVSLQQDINKKDTYVDDGLLGERHTELTVHGTYKFGLETNDIEIKCIDNENGIIFLHMGKPTLISLDIPFDQIKFDKTQGWLRMSMNEKEEKTFYKAVHKNLEKELVSDKELMKQVDLYNKNTIMDLLKMLPEIKSVVFE